MDISSPWLQRVCTSQINSFGFADNFKLKPTAESYLDPTKNGFDRSLLHEYEEWATIQPGFTYHGLNTYAYLLDRYGKYQIKSDSRDSG